MNRSSRVIIAVILAVLAAALWWWNTSRSPQIPAPQVSLRLAGTTAPAAAAMFTAEHEGLFVRQGLDVELQRFSYGAKALEQVLTGQADVAMVAETPVVLAAMRQQEPLAILASIYQSNIQYQIIARKDLGIAAPGDLRGKRIGYPPGTSVAYFTDAYLLTHGIPYNPQQHIAISPNDAALALLEGRVDAVVVFPPYNVHVMKALGERAVALLDPTISEFNFCLVSTRAWALANPQGVQKLLTALIAASGKLREHPREMQAILTHELKLAPDALTDYWKPEGHLVRLHPELLLMLEAIQRWALRRDLVPGASATNLRDLLWFDGLAQVAPQAITVRR